MAYFSEEEVREAFEKRIGPISRDEWNINKPWVLGDITPIHMEDEDIDDYEPLLKKSLKNLRRVRPNSKRQIVETIRIKSKQAERATSHSMILSELWREDLRKDPMAIKILKEADLLRGVLGFHEPMPISHIRNRLVSMGANDTPLGNPLPYPNKMEIFPVDVEQIITERQRSINTEAKKLMIKVKSLKREDSTAAEIHQMIDQGLKEIMRENSKLIKEIISRKWELYSPVCFWNIKYLFVPSNKTFNDLIHYSTTFALVEQCHPALGLACILCDLPLFPRSYPKLEVVKDGQNIQIYVNSLEVSTKVITHIHRQVRNQGIREKRTIQGNWARPKHMKKKNITLYKFCKQNKELNWKSRYEQWNKAYTKWRYASIPKMREAYYKARRRITSTRG